MECIAFKSRVSLSVAPGGALVPLGSVDSEGAVRSIGTASLRRTYSQRATPAITETATLRPTVNPAMSGTLLLREGGSQNPICAASEDGKDELVYCSGHVSFVTAGPVVWMMVEDLPQWPFLEANVRDFSSRMRWHDAGQLTSRRQKLGWK